ncbi:TrmB family transcriptional regulator [Halomarina oriensis]|uniref:Helix-turn-helix domain-containing protein n=1 Tax=Halomarina oriensis TaxID=671145 RepID=A0A6B0GP13_9EURY|nr:helix-turn-helix domain-containing protein [Halomarina oriensis]MWG35711.1 helix-turn-helix domain-containing protein [Halomarina oriensis]
MSETDVFERLGLTEYEQTALIELLTLGRTTAPNLAEATGIPKARVYGVLDSLADQGYVKIIPGRPKHYQPHDPAAILDRAEENRRQELESFVQAVETERESFLAEFQPRFEAAGEDITATEELFHVVDVGDPSERETRRIYREAGDRVCILSKGFEYFHTIEPALTAALERDVTVEVLLLHPDRLSSDERERQGTVVERLTDHDVAVRFSTEQLPWRGTFADPTFSYEGGEAILLVQEDDVPNHLRQAAITENGAFVAGLGRFFDLTWEYESEGVETVEE